MNGNRQCSANLRRVMERKQKTGEVIDQNRKLVCKTCFNVYIETSLFIKVVYRQLTAQCPIFIFYFLPRVQMVNAKLSLMASIYTED